MTVVVTVAKGNDSKSNIFGFCSDCKSSNGKVNKREPVYGKLVGTGLAMDNYAGCGSSCNSHNIG